jgi:nucleoside-diphosphate-sugar epimerase
MNILLTGGTGFIGYNISQKLSKFDKIFFIKRAKSKSKKLNKNIKIINYSSIKNLNKSLKKIKVDIVIHAATHYSKNHNINDLEKFSNSNILFGNVILENLEIMKVKKFINFSTVWENYNSIKENPYNLYSAYKIAFSKIISFYKKSFKKIKFYEFMISDTFGFNDQRIKIINVLRKNYKKNQETKLISKNLYINLLNVEAITKAIDIIKKKDINSGKYLLKNRKDIKLSKLVNIFNKLNKKKLKIHWNSRKIIKQKIYSYKKLKGWKPIKSNIVDIINIIKN